MKLINRPKFQHQVKNRASANINTGGNQISATKVDSLNKNCCPDGSLVIDPAEAYLIDYLMPQQDPDTIFSGQPFVETEKRGIPISFQ